MKTIINKKNTIKDLKFTDKQLFKLLIPLIIEQFLTMFVGLADTIMVAQLGESAVSAVSLVDTVNVLLLGIFTALATGGAVVSGQFRGSEDSENACKSGNQLITACFIFSMVIMTIVYVGKYFILHVVFGNITEDVSNYANLYLLIVNSSIPFIALYNAGAALFRSMGNSAITMKISILMNAINVIGNFICIFIIGMGVEGVAIPTLISRIVAAFVILYMLNNKELEIHLKIKEIIKPDFGMIKRILGIGIPNGVENSMFQLGKILLLSLVSTFGTVQIAANAVANAIAGIQILPASAIGYGMITVVSFCVGAGDIEQARYFTKKLMKIAIVSMLIFNVLFFFLIPFILKIYNLSPETSYIANQIVLLHGSLAIIIWPIAFTLPNSLRAAGDVKFTMIAGMISMWTIRIGAGFLLGKYFGLGVLGTWIAMFIDWVIRSVFFMVRHAGHKWEKMACNN